MGAVDALTVQVAFGEDPYAASPTWTTIGTGYVRGLDLMTSSRTRFQDAFAAGTAQITLDMSDRVYDPTYSGSTHAGGFLFGVPVRVYSSGPTYLWRGYVRRWQPTVKAHDATVTLVCDDALGLFAETTLAKASPAADDQQRIDARLGEIADQLNWPSADRDFDRDGIPLAASEYGIGGLLELHDTARSSPGFVYYDPNDGALHFEGKHAVQTRTRMATSQRTFGTGGTGIVDGSLRLSAVGDTFRNIARVRDSTGTEYTSGSVTSTQVERAVTRTVRTDAGTGHAQNVANWLHDLYDSTETGPNTWQVDAALGTSDQAIAAVAATRLRDRVTVAYDPPGTGTESTEVIVTGIRHSADASRWRATFMAEPAQQYDDLTQSGSWMIVGDATLGQVGTGRVGY